MAISRAVNQQSSQRTSALQSKRSSAQIITYDRTDQSGAKESRYQLIEIRDPNRVQELKRQMGIRAVVVKWREIYLFDNIRIHLDEVTGLGTFLEFEAVLGGESDKATGYAQVAYLQNVFGLEPADLIGGSYADLLLQKTSRRFGSSVET